MFFWPFLWSHQALMLCKICSAIRCNGVSMRVLHSSDVSMLWLDGCSFEIQATALGLYLVCWKISCPRS